MVEGGSDGFGGHVRYLPRGSALALVTLHVGSAALKLLRCALKSLSSSSCLEPKAWFPELVLQADAPRADGLVLLTGPMPIPGLSVDGMGRQVQAEPHGAGTHKLAWLSLLTPRQKL